MPIDLRRAYCQRHGIEYRVLPAAQMSGFPEPPPMPSPCGRKKVVVTGCYDWFHTGHVRFTEEVSAYGDLYVIVGHDANIRLLKGEGHPLLSEAERRYVVGSIKYVKQALISSGEGWLDADPEIRRLKPDIYAVNEDGDKGGKREYCESLGIEYLVLKRTPAPGLPRSQQHRPARVLEGRMKTRRQGDVAFGDHRSVLSAERPTRNRRRRVRNPRRSPASSLGKVAANDAQPLNRTQILAAAKEVRILIT